MSRHHFEHVRAHLDRVRYGHMVTPEPEAVFLGREEEDHFWELIGLRLTGCPVVVLAAFRFRRLELPGIPYARESLASYLSDLPTPRATDEVGMLPALLPHHEQQIPTFLRGLRAGRSISPVDLEPTRIEVAFDFRMENPTAVHDLREAAKPLRDHVYRTVDGHLFRGRSHEVPAGRKDRDLFLAVRSPEQVTPQGIFPLPTLIVNRRYLALRVDTTDEAASAAARNWVPFLPDNASPRPLLPVPEDAPRR